MQPTPNPTPAPSPAPAVADPVVELIRTHRANVGYALTVLAAAFLVTAVMLAVQASRLGAAVPSTEIDKSKDGKDAEDPLKSLPTSGGAVTQKNQFDYYSGAIGAALGLVVVGSGAAYLIVGLPKPTEAEQRREARILILAVGGLLGTALMLVGAFFLYRWSESLMAWLDKGELDQAKWVLIPLLMVMVGGAIVFFSIQPARAEERNDALVRKFVYGSNFGLTALILLVVLVIGNAVVAMQLPNKLDVTNTGFYTLSPQTDQALKGLDQPIRAYAIFQAGGDTATDLKRFLMLCQDANPGKFRVTFLSPALNRTEINKLKTDYPLAEMSQEGVLLVAGEEGGADRKRHTFIRADEFEGETVTGAGGKPVPAFNAEPRILRELMFLSENKQKPKVYFTQSSGELSLGGRGANARRSAANLKGYLEKNYFEVAELTFDLGAPAKVPDDATVVVVADPAATLPDNGVEAIRKFMSEPRPDGKKGKLVVLAGAQAGPDGKALKLGLEPTLGTFGVRLAEGFLYAEPLRQLGDWDRAEGTRVHLADITPEAVEARNPVALNFNKVNLLPLLDCREVSAGRGPGAQAVAVLASQPGRTTWVEQTRPNNPADAWRALAERVKQISEGPGTGQEKRTQISDFLRQAQVSEASRELAVFVSERDKDKEVARVAVFGCGWFVSDDAGVRAQGMSRGQAPTLWLDLMGSTLDWIRDRPTVIGPAPKAYTVYAMKPGYDSLRLVFVPLGLSLVLVLGAGVGVWVIRRK